MFGSIFTEISAAFLAEVFEIKAAEISALRINISIAWAVYGSTVVYQFKMIAYFVELLILKDTVELKTKGTDDSNMTTGSKFI